MNCQQILAVLLRNQESSMDLPRGIGGVRMKRTLAFAIIFPYLLATCGCAAAVLGLGAAAGTGAAYVAGKDTRIYDSEYHQTAQACVETLNSLKIPVSQISADELKTTIQAKRADETPVYIEVVRLGQPGRSEVGIRTGVVGISESEISNQIHDALKDRLRHKDHELANTTDTAKSQIEETEQPAETLNQQGPISKTGEPSSITFARRAPLELTIYFPPNSNELRPSEIAKLNKVTETISQHPEATLILNGYTDSVGASDYNLIIAESRAASVKLYFVGKGVNPQRITVVGKGAKDFVASNDNEEGRNLNRRVEIQIDRKR
jgi:outer membrane protein OmpA-like peptidoglycan-associated protein